MITKTEVWRRERQPDSPGMIEGEEMAYSDRQLLCKESDGTGKAAIYCRLSEEDRNKAHKNDDSNSIMNQKSMLLQYAMGQGWEIYDIYSDDDYAGADRNRPQFKRLIADAEARRFDIILCKTQSRFTRELELVEKYIHGLFPIWGIRFVSIVDNADTANKGNKKSRQINGLVNEWYLEDMSDNIRSVLTSRRENGYHIGAFAPYGYKKDPELRGHLIIDEEAAQIVREIFSLFAEGYGKTSIARILNDRGIPNPTEYKRQKGYRYIQGIRPASFLWKYHSVQWILSNEAYIGNLVQARSGSISYKTKQIAARPKDQWIRVEKTHEPIIDKELWDRVQKKINSRAKTTKSTGKVHLFSKIAVCMHCGYALRSHKCHNKYYMQCETKYISKEACPGAFIPEAELEQIVTAELRKWNQDLLDRRRLEREVQFDTAQNSKKAKLMSQIRHYQEKLDECGKILQNLYVDKTTGRISRKDYLELRRSFQADQARYESTLALSQSQIRDIDACLSRGDNRCEILAQYVNAEHLTRPMAESLIDHIEVGKREKKNGQVPVTIFWRF